MKKLKINKDVEFKDVQGKVRRLLLDLRFSRTFEKKIAKSEDFAQQGGMFKASLN